MMTNNKGNVLYIGMTNDLFRRVTEHKNGFIKNSFTDKYHCHKFIYYEEYLDVNDAIAREKQLKGWKREWKDELVTKLNPERKDLFQEVFPLIK